MPSVTVYPASNVKSKVFPLVLSNVSSSTTINDLKVQIAAAYPRLYSTRQKLTYKSSENKKALSDEVQPLTTTDDIELEVKDLGPQIGWRTVFLIEYGGPIFIHAFIYLFPSLIFGRNFQHSEMQRIAFIFAILHYVKRELETIFVHRFSLATMPFRNIFKNCFHYHVLGGLFLAFDVYRPTFSKPTGTFRDNEENLMILFGIGLFFELSNLWTHLTLRRLRPEGTRKRAIPYGYGFNLVAFPNYLFETLGWVTFSVMTGSYASWFFTAVSFVQMSIWANKKTKAYKKEFGKEWPRNRKALIPFIF